MAESEMLGTRPGGMQDLATRRALVEASNHDRQLRTPRLDPPYERSDGSTTAAAQSDDDERGTLIAKPLNELIAVALKL